MVGRHFDARRGEEGRMEQKRAADLESWGGLASQRDKWAALKASEECLEAAS